MLSNLKKAASNSFIYSIGRLSTKIVGLILIPIYTEKLTTADYGILGLLEITSELLLAVFSLTLYSAFVRLYWDKKFVNKQGEMFFTYMTTLVILGMLMFISLTPFIKMLSKYLLGNVEFDYLIKLMLFSTTLKMINRAPTTLMRVQEKPTLFTVVNVSRLAVILLFTIYFIVYRGHKVDGIFEAQIIGQIFYTIILSKFIISNIKLKIDLSILRSMVAYSLPLVFSAISSLLLTVGDRYCLRILAEISEVGLYNLGFKLANVLRVFFISSVNLALPPMIFKMIGQPNSKRFYSKIMTYLTFTLSIMVLFISLYSKEIIRVIAKDSSYWSAYQVVPILSFSSLFLLLMSSSSIGLNIMKKTRIMAKNVVLIALLNIALNFLMIPHFSIIGASLATLISRIIHFAIVYFIAQRIYRIPFEMKKVVTMLSVSLVLVIIGVSVNELDLIFRLTIKAALIISFPFILYFLNFYEEIELLRIKQTWRKWRNPLKLGKNVKNLLKGKDDISNNIDE